MNYKAYKDLLSEFIKFKSISTDAAYQGDIQKTVEWLKSTLENGGFTVELWNGPKSNPVVFGNYQVDPSAKTVLVYGHYDVQPADKNDGWFEDPFTLFEKEGRVYARGSVDNKGQVLTHIHTVLELIKAGKLKYNVMFLVEGNEETSNDDLAGLIKQNKDKLNVDYVMVSDGEIVGKNPVIEYSLRGGFNCKVIYKTANNNLHSGIYGGAAPNSAIELVKLLNKLFTHETKHIGLPGFYEGVDEVTDEMRSNNEKLSKMSEEAVEAAGIKELVTEDSNDLYTQTGLQPTIEITGFKSGYIGEGYSNIIPFQSEVRLNFRTVNSQDNVKLIESLKTFVSENTPDYVDFDIEFTNHYDSVKVNVDQPIVKEVSDLLEKAYGDEVYLKPVGGGIPVVSDFKEVLGIDVLLVSLGNEDCNMHGVNENFNVELLEKGLKFSEMYFSN